VRVHDGKVAIHRAQAYLLTHSIHQMATQVVLPSGEWNEPKFRFPFGSPQKRGFGFGFKTDPGLNTTQANLLPVQEETLTDPPS